MVASAELRRSLAARARAAEKCRGQNCCDRGELALVLRSSYDKGEWWRCKSCEAFHMTPEQEEKKALWWGGPRPPLKAHKWAPPGGKPYATIDERGLRAEQGLCAQATDARVWLYGPTTGRRLAELGLNHAEVYVTRQARAQLDVQQPVSLSRRFGRAGVIRPEYQPYGGTVRSRSLGNQEYRNPELQR